MVLTKEDGSDHVGHFVKTVLSKNPDNICQIDGATGEQETKRSVLSRTIQLAYSLQKFGLKPGDVMALGGRNHLDLHIPFYAALMTGLPMAGVDPLFKYALFKIIAPKITFCEPESYEDVRKVSSDLGLDTLIVTFRGGEYPMQKFMEDYQDPRPEEMFKIPRIDPDKAYAWLGSTSGTTGTPKVAAIRHPEVVAAANNFSMSMLAPKNDTTTLHCGLNMSSMQWLSACYNALTLPLNYIKLQSSAPSTPEHVGEIINKYKPKIVMTTPTLLARVMHTGCDFTCFDTIVVGGSKVHEQFLIELKNRVRKDTLVMAVYGQTETIGSALIPRPGSPMTSIGRKTPQYEVKLVDPESGKEITDPNATGELFLKGPRMAGYYNDPEATAAAFTEDGWFKTGDLLYRDEHENFFFVDRLKMLIKYRNYQIVPPEVEEVIESHPDVLEVCVSSIFHPEDGEHLVACVVRRPGSKVTAQEIKDLVAEKLSVNKQLYGGVVFVDQLPVTSTVKVARMKVKEFLKTAVRE